MLRFILTFLLIAAAPCATRASPPIDLMPLSSPSITQSTAQLFVLRSNSPTAALRSFIVWIDGKKAVTLPYRRSNAALEIPEGEHTVRFSCSTDCALRTVKISATFVAGREYYLLIDPNYKRDKGIEMSVITFTLLVRQITREQYLQLVDEYKEIKTF